MKRTLLFVLALVASGCADPIPRNLDGLVQQGDTYLDRETMRPYSGPVFELASDDTTRVQFISNLKDGKYDGPLESYYENGQLSQKGTYVAGKRHGPFEDYYKNGQLYSKSHLVDGKRDGPYERYAENGQLEVKGPYVAGEWHGLVESYHENGQLDTKYTYVDGVWHGPWEWYHENGQFYGKGTFNMDENCGQSFISGRTQTYDPCPPGLADGN